MVIETAWTLLLALGLAQPLVEMPDEPPPEEAEPALSLGAGEVPDTTLVRGLQNLRLQLPGTVLGSYGQFNLEYAQPEFRGPYEGTATVRRLVLFVSHHFTDTVRAYTEVEWENAVACSNCAGAVEIEQGFVDWDVDPAVTLRSGLILVPMGITNQWHEPPVFHGVNRPSVETLIIPSTWRELGVGVTGHLADTWHYEAYAMTSPDAQKLGALGLRGALGLGSAQWANAWMLSARLEAEPLLGFVVGAAAVGGDMGDGARYANVDGAPVALHEPWWGVAVDGRWRRQGIEARAVAAGFWLPDAGALMTARGRDGSLVYPDPTITGTIPTFWYGAYAELAYDVLHLTSATGHQLLPFVRVETYDTQAAVPAGWTRDVARRVLEVTGGMSYRPIQQLVFKADGRGLWRRGGGGEARWELGLGYMF